MLVDPLLFALRLFIYILRMVVMLIVKFCKAVCKAGFGWMLLGYVCDFLFLEERAGTAHVVFMVIAWGGTFLHFFGTRIYSAVRNRSCEEQEQ